MSVPAALQLQGVAAASGDGLAVASAPAVLDISFCNFSGLVPDALFPARGRDTPRAWQPAVFAMGNAFACPLPRGVTAADNMTCSAAAAPAPGAAAPAPPSAAATAPAAAQLVGAAPALAVATGVLQSAPAAVQPANRRAAAVGLSVSGVHAGWTGAG